jgi:hypothetical protein
MPEIRKHLGYRLSLVSSDFPASVRTGSVLSGNVVITNKGWATPINSRPVHLVLRSVGNPPYKLYRFLLNTNVREWRPNTSVQITVAAHISDVPEGRYDLFLSLPDPASILGYPSYSIQLANPGVWSTYSNGMNNLSQVVNVAAPLPIIGPQVFTSPFQKLAPN